jgi:hypothetical protein
VSAVLPSDSAGPARSFNDPSCALDTAPRRSSIGAGAVAAAIVAQGAALTVVHRAGAAAVLIATVIAAACAVAWTQRSRVRHADVVIATAAFGGLGMRIGGWITCATSKEGVHHGMMIRGSISRLAPLGETHHGTMHCAQTAASPFVAAGVMVLACVAACEWTCAPLCRGGWMRRLVMHAVVAAAMLAGMWAADALLSHVVEAPGAPAMHAAMVLGMAVGAAAALRGADRLASSRRA